MPRSPFPTTMIDLGIESWQIEKELCQRSFKFFVKAFWKAIEPSQPFVDNWHIDAICDHLTACTDGEIKNLVINIPPRHMKSTLVSILWPAWVWTTKPETRWICASYAAQLAKRDSLSCRAVLTDPKYIQYWWPNWRFKEDQNEKFRFDNTARGFRLATSVGGSLTGEGGDFLIIDDPHKASDMSDVKRESVLEWHDATFTTRANNPKTACRLIIMQRLHEKDLAGHLIERGYGLLKLPAEYEPKLSVTSPLGFTDPREEPGELLWPERFSKESIDDLKRNLGSLGYSGQFQQNPVPAEGGLFKRSWWKFYGERPAKFNRIVQFWDCAQKPGITNDYSVCATWMETDEGFYLLDVWRNKVETPQLEAAAKTLASQFTPNSIVIEDKSAGSALIQYLRQKTTLPVIAYNPGSRDKEVRASAVTPTVEAGNCYLPEAEPWVEEFILEHERFPRVAHDDQVDTTSMALDTLRKATQVYRIRQL